MKDEVRIEEWGKKDRNEYSDLLSHGVGVMSRMYIAERG